MPVDPTAGQNRRPARAAARRLLGGCAVDAAHIAFGQLQPRQVGRHALFNGLAQFFVLQTVHANQQGFVGIGLGGLRWGEWRGVGYRAAGYQAQTESEGQRNSGVAHGISATWHWLTAPSSLDNPWLLSRHHIRFYPL